MYRNDLKQSLIQSGYAASNFYCKIRKNVDDTTPILVYLQLAEEINHPQTEKHSNIRRAIMSVTDNIIFKHNEQRI